MPKTKNDVIRITVSVPTEHHQEMENIAFKNKVSVAWVVRDAIEKYLEINDHGGVNVNKP